MKIQLEKAALPWYWVCFLSIIMLSYLLGFVQLTLLGGGQEGRRGRGGVCGGKSLNKIER